MIQFKQRPGYHEIMKSFDSVIAAMKRGELAYRASDAHPEAMQYPGVGFGTCGVGSWMHKFVSENYPRAWVTLDRVEARRQDHISRRPTNPPAV
jgi:hypothetical protein